MAHNQEEFDALSEKYQAIHEALIETYGEPEWRQHAPPVDVLVSTILSQNTSDTNRDRAFAALKERYPNWEQVMGAPEEAIVEAIRSAGLANQKAPRIQRALRRVWEAQDELDLSFLEEMTLDEAKQWLVAIKGIGPKTAAIILLFAFNRPAFPVDTHVHRVTRRLGLISRKVRADKAHDMLENIGNPDTFYAFHINLIRHGRETCRARNPRCPQCSLQSLCDYYAHHYGDAVGTE